MICCKEYSGAGKDFAQSYVLKSFSQARNSAILELCQKVVNLGDLFNSILMEYVKKVLEVAGWQVLSSTDFVIQKDNFSDLQINPVEEKEQFYYFSDKKNREADKTIHFN